MRVRRLAVGVVVAVLAATATACGGNDNGSTASGGSGKNYKVGVSIYAKDIPLYVEMRKGMERQAQSAGASLDFAYANYDAQTQINQIQQFVTRGMDAILVSPLDAKAIIPAYKAAHDANIPILSIANREDTENESAFIGRDWSIMGKAMIDYIAKQTGGNAKVAAVSGPPTLDVVRAVSDGWKQGMEANPGMTMVQTLVDPDMSTAKAVDLANTLFSSHKDIDAVVTTIDLIGLGVAQAAKEQGIDQNKIVIAAMDAQPQSIAQIKNGSGLDFTVAFKPQSWGELAVKTAVDYLNGEKPAEHTVPSEYQFVTKDNAASLTEADLS